MKKDMTDPIITRRDFLIACSIGGTATFVMYHIIKPSRLLFGEESNTAEHIQWNPSEYIENWEKTLLTLFQLQYKGDRAELIFVDQHGKLITVISTTDKIKNKKGHAIPAWSPNKKQFDQEWLNAWRYKIHTQYPSLEFDLTFNQELPKQMNSRRTVETTRYQSNIEHVLDYGSRIVPGTNLSHIAYAKQIFSQPTLTTTSLTPLPAGIRKRLSEISYGIAGIESGFNNSQISPVKAQSVWQILPITFHHLCQKLNLEADYENFITTTTAANRHCEEIYQYLIHSCSDEFDLIRTRFHFSKQDFENQFIFPCLISAYHTGQGRLKKVIHWFANQHDKKKLNQKIGTYPNGYGYDLFGQMTRLCYQEKTVSGYGRQSWEYFLRANAMATLIRQKYFNDPKNFSNSIYQPPQSFSPTFLTQTIDFLPSLATGILMFKSYNLDYKKIQKNAKSFAKKALIVFSCLFTLIVGISMIVKYYQSTPFSWDSNYAGATFTYNKKLAHELSRQPNLFTKTPNKQYYAVKMPRRIHNKLVNPWLEKHNLLTEFYPTRMAIRQAAEKRELIPLSYEGNQFYRCRTLGLRLLKQDKKIKALGSQNHPDYIYLKPSTEQMIIKINQLMNIELHEKFGLHNDYGIRLIINSAIRDTVYNMNIPGSVATSTHQLGLAIDFSVNSFDIINYKAKTFIYLYGNNAEKIDKKHHLRENVRQALKFVLVKLHNAGELFTIKEKGHYHVTDKAGMP